ncbi:MULTISPECIES: Crp/Fnr family transcriptional regulator [Actinomycetes]|uniref:HTH-type transcriptional regulator Cmr n=2 Tax=Actinomycetes TaxID=1760 RepID=A0ABP6LYZ5_9MICC
MAPSRFLTLPWQQVTAETAGPDAEMAALRQAAWVARCVGRGASAPLSATDVSAIATYLTTRQFEPGQKLFADGMAPGAEPESAGVWIIRSGRVELIAGAGERRSVVHVLHPGDVDGDVQLLLDMPFPYTGRALEEVTALHLEADGFERLLGHHPAIARRWLASIAERLAMSQNRIIGLLGRSLPAQISQVLLDEAVQGEVLLPQRTVAAMIGVQRPSLNKVLKDLERRGVIGVGYGVITLRDAEALAELAR